MLKLKQYIIYILLKKFLKSFTFDEKKNKKQMTRREIEICRVI